MRKVDLRVGRKSRRYQEISIEVMKLLMEKMEVEVKEKVSLLERRDLTKKGDYFMICFCGIFKGGKGVYDG